MPHRFFVPPESISQNKVTFGAAHVHQLCNVLRMRAGARVIVLDDSGLEYEVELTQVGRNTVTGHICAQRATQAEPHLRLTLYQGTLKGDRFEWILQKGTELGASAFVPVLCERSVSRDIKRVGGKRPRWERIIREAAEQSHRGRLPRLAAPLSFDRACQESVRENNLSLLLWEEATQESLSGVLRSFSGDLARVALLVGPEGGFASHEVAQARRHGIGVVTLGPRVLRAETAAIVSAAIVMSELGEMGKRESAT
jgi:16S rRNA (uracil1498-N3)-methyltransferase